MGSRKRGNNSVPPTSHPVAVISGSGTDSLFSKENRRTVPTQFGDVVIYDALAGRRRFFLLPRHGPNLDIPPHRINFRANISALKTLGVESILATSAVGSLQKQIKVGDLGLVSQFLDFTKTRPATFFDEKAVHTDMTAPYDRRLNSLIERSAHRLSFRLMTQLVYVCAEGPRYETAAEIAMFRMLGGDIVGMTGVPEVVLSKELRMNYALIVVVTNWAAGMQRRISHEEVLSAMTKAGTRLKGLIEASVQSI